MDEINLNGISKTDLYSFITSTFLGSFISVVVIIGGVKIGGYYIIVSLVFIWVWFRLILSTIFITKTVTLTKDQGIIVQYLLHQQFYTLNEFELIEIKWMGYFIADGLILHFKNKNVLRKSITINLANDRTELLKFINILYKKNIKVSSRNLSKTHITFNSKKKLFE